MPYGRDFNANYNDDYNSKYNTEYNTEFLKKLYYREYCPKWDPDSDLKILSYKTTMAIVDYKSTSESTLNQALPIDIPYEVEWD